MSAMLATTWRQDSLIPRGREGYRRWRSGMARNARVLATSRSHSPETQAIASRIFGTLAFPSHRDSTGTVYGRVSTLSADTGGWEVREMQHPDCPGCASAIFEAIAMAASTGSIGATFNARTREVGADGEPEYLGHWVSVMRGES